MSKTKLLQKLGEQKLLELLDRIENCQVALDVIREEFETIKKGLNLSKTEDSIMRGLSRDLLC